MKVTSNGRKNGFSSPDTKVRENQAPKATEAIPPIALTRKTCPKDSGLKIRS